MGPFDIIVHNLPFLLVGLKVTAELSAIAIVGGTALGLLLGTIRYMRWPVLNAITLAFIELIRGTPLLVVLFICYFALPALLSYHTTAYNAAALGFVLFISAYLAEDFRSGLRSVRQQTVHAALATGLTPVQTLRFIVVPQAVRRVIPTIFSQYVRVFKFTSIASVIGIHELTGSALLVNAREFRPIVILATVAITYFVCCYAISLVGRHLYKKLMIRS
jgi:His/Glu/Gln/Arg/opine family amino acid ABC transporter permease subunit